MTIDEITVERHDFDPLKSVHRILINSSEKPIFIQLNELKQGETYIYESNSKKGLHIWRPYCQQLFYNPLTDNSIIFMYNGTNMKTTKSIGLAARLLETNGTPLQAGTTVPYACLEGLHVNGLILYVHTAYSNDSDPEFAKMVIMDASRIDPNYVVYASFVYWGLFEVEGYLFSWSLDKEKQYLLITITTDYPNGKLKDLVFAGADYPWPLPNIKVYGGWPGDKDSVLLATYSDETRYLTLPQRFGGRIRTFVVENVNKEVDLWFFDPNSPISQSYEISTLYVDSTSDGFSDPFYADNDYQGGMRDFVPIPGRKGFIRSNWMDGSYAKESKGVLELQETVNSTFFSFSFTFEPDCAEDAVLSIKAYKNDTEQSHNLKCRTDEIALTISATHLTAELIGDGVVNYEVSLASFVDGYLKTHILILPLIFHYKTINS